MRRFLAAATAAMIGMGGLPARAWDDVGHKVSAYIAYKRLDQDPQVRQRVIDALKKHPAYKDDWTHRDPGAGEEGLKLFLYAAIFPDDARHMPKYSDWNEPEIHYVNFPVLPFPEDYHNPAVHVKNPYARPNILQAYPDKFKATRLSPDPAERAVALSWVFHLVGDAHHPLHTADGYSAAAFPHGDAGGNGLRVAGKKLHAFWDELLDPTDPHGDVVLGRDGRAAEDFGTIERIAEALLADPQLAPDSLPELARGGTIDSWTQESLSLAKRHIYAPGGPFDLRVRNVPEFPVGYRADSTKVARRQIALAGYRLAEELERIYGTASP